MFLEGHMEFQDYFWKEGIPIGLRPRKGVSLLPRHYKIVTDPYRKRWVVEKYTEGVWEGVIYDSALFDFRRLKIMAEEPWERETICRTREQETILLRDPEDRLVAREIFSFQGGKQKRWELQSIHGIPICSHTLFSTLWGDSFSGLVLRDREGRMILWKQYELDPNTHAFSKLVRESWDPHHEPSPFMNDEK